MHGGRARHHPRRNEEDDVNKSGDRVRLVFLEEVWVVVVGELVGQGGVPFLAAFVNDVGDVSWYVGDTNETPVNLKEVRSEMGF